MLLVLAVGFYAIWAGQAKAANLMPDFMENRIGYEIIDGTDQVEVCIFDGHWWSELPDAYTIPSQVTCTDAESPYYTQTFQVVGIQPRAFSEGAPSSEGQNVSITIEAVSYTHLFSMLEKIGSAICLDQCHFGKIADSRFAS